MSARNSLGGNNLLYFPFPFLLSFPFFAPVIQLDIRTQNEYAEQSAYRLQDDWAPGRKKRKDENVKMHEPQSRLFGRLED